MSQSKKIILGIFTFLPLILIIVYFVSFFSLIINEMPPLESSGGRLDPDEMLGNMIPLFAILGTMVIVTIGLVIYYLLDIFQYNPKFKNEKGNSRLMWTLIVILAGMLGMIIYFFAEIVPRKELPPLPHNHNL